MTITITLVIIVITAIISFLAFNDGNLENKLIFDPPAITYRNEWYRFITCGFIHGDIPHLIFNMYSLYLFGPIVEAYFTSIFGSKGGLIYVLLYITALAMCMLPTYAKNKTNYHYRSLGASGAISAVIFSYVLLDPLRGMGLLIIPGLYIPGFLFGILYLVTSSIMAKKANSHINHSAHIWGAIYGMAFLIVTSLVLSDFNPISNFTAQVAGYLQSKFR